MLLASVLFFSSCFPVLCPVARAASSRRLVAGGRLVASRSKCTSKRQMLLDGVCFLVSPKLLYKTYQKLLVKRCLQLKAWGVMRGVIERKDVQVVQLFNGCFLCLVAANGMASMMDLPMFGWESDFTDLC